MPTKYGVPGFLAKGDTRATGSLQPCHKGGRRGVADHIAHLNCSVPTTYGALYSHPGAPTWPPIMGSLGLGVRAQGHKGVRVPSNDPSDRVRPHSMYLNYCVPTIYIYGALYNHPGGAYMPTKYGVPGSLAKGDTREKGLQPCNKGGRGEPTM